MPRFSIFSFEIKTTEEVSAGGIAEAMIKYLPWPDLDISIKMHPNSKEALVTDRQTDFQYKVVALD